MLRGGDFRGGSRALVVVMEQWNIVRVAADSTKKPTETQQEANGKEQVSSASASIAVFLQCSLGYSPTRSQRTKQHTEQSVEGRLWLWKTIANSFSCHAHLPPPSMGQLKGLQKWLLSMGCQYSRKLLFQFYPISTGDTRYQRGLPCEKDNALEKSVQEA